MSDWLSHEPCPKCREMGRDRAGDNLAVHSDGHKHCFSCGHREFPEGFSLQFHSVELPRKEEENGLGIHLPSDYSHFIPPKPLAWVKQYRITDLEIRDNKIGYSVSKELLCFPVTDPTGNLLLWQGRYFGSNPEYPKYVTYGQTNNLFHFVGRFQDPIKTGIKTTVIIEDFISAIKVGRQLPALPLWGSDISKTKLFRLSKMFDNLVVWLDPDKKEHSIKLQKRAEIFFAGVSVVYSERDPKSYNEKEIKDFLERTNLPLDF